jgi:hypothetical protein
MQAAEINCILAYKKVPNCQLFFNTSDYRNYRKNNTGGSNQKITAYSGTDLKTCIPDL